jgi:hypothetical protein
MRWVSLPILAQLFYIWMYAGKLKSEIVTYIESISVLDKRQTDGGKVVTPKRRPHFTPRFLF